MDLLNLAMPDIPGAGDPEYRRLLFDAEARYLRSWQATASRWLLVFVRIACVCTIKLLFLWRDCTDKAMRGLGSVVLLPVDLSVVAMFTLLQFLVPPKSREHDIFVEMPEMPNADVDLAMLRTLFWSRQPVAVGNFFTTLEVPKQISFTPIDSVGLAAVEPQLAAELDAVHKSMADHSPGPEVNLAVQSTNRIPTARLNRLMGNLGSVLGTFIWGGTTGQPPVPVNQISQEKPPVTQRRFRESKDDWIRITPPSSPQVPVFEADVHKTRPWFSLHRRTHTRLLRRRTRLHQPWHFLWRPQDHRGLEEYTRAAGRRGSLHRRNRVMSVKRV